MKKEAIYRRADHPNLARGWEPGRAGEGSVQAPQHLGTDVL